ncbi:MAG: D-inositol-3-phosphate glycosyltransferase [Chroococcopsis gigantea SAG 12.99]|jgi:glycosyltransferase involved in cell wall biosynthesis|nr:glycosyltransferase family 4 protein [Chlorogloea purpurea SAG 13.99]MDV3000272.1 D-inositol-3-phosphate glycosyltransferase [Chroococcopsis gigantea SAG 12.99]
MLKISIDATPIRDKPSGIGLYVYELIKELWEMQSEGNFGLQITYQPSVRNWVKNNRDIPERLKAFPEIDRLSLPVTLSHLLTSFPNLAIDYLSRYFDDADIIHGTDHVVFPCKGSLKVMTIHDLTFIKYPQFVNNIVKTYTARIKDCLRWTDLVIANSESTKRDIIQYLGVKEKLIRVTPLASRYSNYSPPAEDTIPENIYDWSQPYILFVSTIEPRKNISALIQAFNYLKSRYKIPHNLVLIGQKGWLYESIFQAINQSPSAECIYHLNYLSDDAVAWFYRRADVFVYPSFYEGFGLPVLEAMTLGCPVITADTSSLPEVAGDGALLINPTDNLQLASAILQVISDSAYRESLITKGYIQARKFSWQKTARLTLAAYQSLL